MRFVGAAPSLVLAIGLECCVNVYTLGACIKED